ncbi:MAG: DUF402 domain-containing protein [Mollicutes bacterium]|nr:DUF402 domain-containing protein [Mollicutes bacterium]
MKKGDKLAIHCYKHNGKIDRISGEAVVLDIKKDYIVCANDKVKLTENDGRTHYTKEAAILFFYKNEWFNILAQFKKYGLFYYCNIASPYLIDGNIIKYIDYDLDLRIFPDGKHRILDKNEYKYHSKKMGYSKEIDLIVKHSLNKLIDIKEKGKVPFKKEVVMKYYNEYKALKNK